jgi:hypothetical protein
MNKKLSELFVDVGQTLVQKVIEEKDKIETDFGTTVSDSLTYMIAKFQADSVIAYQTVKQMNDVVITSNSDQSVHTGIDCIYIKDYTLKEKKNKTLLENISLFCAAKKIRVYY